MKATFNPQTKQIIDNYIQMPGQSLGIFAPNGSGKFFTAEYIAKQLLQSTRKADIHIVRPIEKDSIVIEQIRELHPLLKQKALQGTDVNRVIIIDQADKMTIQAQNALLKKLEEPPKGVVFILTASSKMNLLPTIVSRLVLCSIKRASKTEVLAAFSEDYDKATIEKVWLISNGKLGLMHDLLADQDHSLLIAIDEAKQIIKGSRFERLCAVDGLLKQNYLTVLDGLEILSRSGITQSAKKNARDATSRWHDVAVNVSHAKQALSCNCNAKLVLTNLMLSL